MRIRAILRFRNEDLTRKRLIAGFKTQRELADFLNISQSAISAWEVFKNFPKRKKIIKKLEIALHCPIEDLFPPEFIKAIEKKGLLPLEKVIDIRELPGYTRGEYLLSSPEEARDLKGLVKSIDESLLMLKERDAKVLKLRFGLFEHEGHEHTLQEIADILGVTKERIRQIEAKALRMLKHPSRSKSLREFI